MGGSSGGGRKEGEGVPKPEDVIGSFVQRGLSLASDMESQAKAESAKFDESDSPSDMTDYRTREKRLESAADKIRDGISLLGWEFPKEPKPKV